MVGKLLGLLWQTDFVSDEWSLSVVFEIVSRYGEFPLMNSFFFAILGCYHFDSVELGSCTCALCGFEELRA